MDSHHSKSLHLPDGMAYTCHNTGVCCGVFDTIPVDAGCAQHLDNLDESVLHKAAGNSADMIPIRVAGLPGDPPKIARKQDGTCSMYGADHLCAIHKLGGAAAKPHVCRDFPYRYTETPGGVYVGLSFVCPSVRGGKGQLLTNQRAELESHYQTAKSILEAEPEIFLNRRIALRWEEYLELEKSILELLELRQAPLRQRLIACCALINFVDAYFEQLRGEPVTRAGEHMPAGALAEFLSAMRRTEYADLLRVAGRVSPPGALRAKRMFLGMFAGFANTLHRTGGRAHTVASVMAQYARHALGMGGVRLRPVEGTVSHARLADSRLPESGPAAELLERYVIHCIFRKDLILSGNVARRLRLLLLNVALIPWYAAAESARRGKPSAEDEDFFEAVGHVEKFYGFHSRFYRFFEKNRAFDDIVEAFLLKPNYPFVVLAE